MIDTSMCDGSVGLPEYMSEVVDPGQKSGDEEEGDRHQEPTESSPWCSKERPSVKHFDAQTGE